MKPQNAWGPLFMLSAYGEQKAIPLAMNAGANFFTIKVAHFEDVALFEHYCPKNLEHCDCSTTFFSRQFANEQQFSRSM